MAVEQTIIDIEAFSNIYEISLNQIPNQELSTTIDTNVFDIEIRTFTNDRSCITIKKDGVFLCNNANIKLGVDLTYFGGLDNYQFFFLKQNEQEKEYYNYTDFDINIRLYCGII